MKSQKIKILSIDTSCDETAAAVTENTKVLSNTIWSQASLHAKFGGVYPSLAKREHQKRINWVIEKSLKSSAVKFEELDAVAVTVGPGLAIALEVGINKAKEISQKYKIPFISVNHIEGHILSPLAGPKNKEISHTLNLKSKIAFPSIGIVTSGGHTQIIYIETIGKYEILASTMDDALGEGLDKAARMLGLGYPGGPLLEKLAENGDRNIYSLPVPMVGQEKRMVFSYSGLKTALYRKIEDIKSAKKELTKKDIENISATFQFTAFTHFLRVFEWMIKNERIKDTKNILAGGGVMANLTLRKMLRNLADKHLLKIHFPYTKKLYGDNAGMIGVAAFFKMQRKDFDKNLQLVDRVPNAKIDKPFPWE